ncbi:MAG: RIP metalloprotease RseP [Bryobacterales bacterium]|nr:RIP metalloprotease RseP [Bryobacterales bacterium]
MEFFESFWWLLVLLGVMIIIHELGHYWAAVLCDVKVDVFSVGFGPRLFGFRRGETDFRFSAILFGGYVKMAGEQPGEGPSDDPRAFSNKPRWQRLLIVFAGPLMNVVLAVGLLTGLYMVRYYKPSDSYMHAVIGWVDQGSPAAKAGIEKGDRVIEIDGRKNPSWDDLKEAESFNANRAISVTVERGQGTLKTTVTPTFDDEIGVGSAGWREDNDVEVGSVRPGSAAEKAGLQAGDVIVSANGVPIRSSYGLPKLVEANKGNPISLVYERDGTRTTTSITPTREEVNGKMRWLMGVSISPKRELTRLGFAPALGLSLETNARYATVILRFFRGMVERRMSPKSLEGPIGIARMSRSAAHQGVFEFSLLMAMVSLNLAVVNLLPIPVLDGGMIFMLLIEMAVRRDLSLQIKEAMFRVGFVFLLAVMAFVIYNDISKTAGG